MNKKSFDMQLVGVTGGPCPVCDEVGLLLSDCGTYSAERTLRHQTSKQTTRECTMPMSAGRLEVTADGIWSFRPAEKTCDESS